MAELTFDTETLGYIRLFEERTGARVKDCFEAEDKLVYLVQPGEIHKAVGPGGVVVDRFKGMLKKEIQVIEYSDVEETLVRNIFFPFSPRSVEIAPKGKGRHATVTVDPAWKARAIGKAGKNLKIARAVLLRHTSVDSISVA
ncbi:MAG TPA: NusA-like transcription termination signal-binding factor [Thermoplasmata archaeon]|nr:NusA-like transcription termination signal-binding factor [Thermoplasmata archaeon]